MLVNKLQLKKIARYLDGAIETIEAKIERYESIGHTRKADIYKAKLLDKKILKFTIGRKTNGKQ